MMVIKWLVLAMCAIVLTVLAFPLAFVLPLFALRTSHLPWWLSWFQTPDAALDGDELFHINQTLHDSWYWRCVKWQWRNPAQGFDMWARASVNTNTAVQVRGNLAATDGAEGVAGWFLIACPGAFQFCWIVPVGFHRCLHIGLGWRLTPIAKRYASQTLGQLIATPVRIFRFK